MLNKTILYYLLSGFEYYNLRKNREYRYAIKNKVNNEIKYFFNQRYVRNENWYLRYLKILSSVLTINLLARYFEKLLVKKCSFLGQKYTIFAPATYYALHTFNTNRKAFDVNIHKEIFIYELIAEISQKVYSFWHSHQNSFKYCSFIHGNTPLGIELEFSNVGANAGKLMVSGKNDALLNFSKYHHYHLRKFMWRFGAYIDAEMPFKQFIKKGGFLEYTFTKPDYSFSSSMPLTNSPCFASKLIEEAVKFTPVKPHSLHVTVESSNIKTDRPTIGFNELIFLLLCTGHFVNIDGKIVESRIMEKNMKDICVTRKRKNHGKWIDTIEFSSVRLCRDFVKRGIYEPIIMFFIAYKNLFKFPDILPYYQELLKWGKSPYVKKSSYNEMFEILEKGIEIEKTLPIHYKMSIISKIKDNFKYNCSLIGVSYE